MYIQIFVILSIVTFIILGKIIHSQGNDISELKDFTQHAFNNIRGLYENDSLKFRRKLKELEDKIATEEKNND